MNTGQGMQNLHVRRIIQ